MAWRVVTVRGLNRPEQRQGIVYVGRAFAGWPGHPLANPFRPATCVLLASDGSLDAAASRSCAIADCLDRYRDWLLARPTLEADLAALWNECEHGARPLGCWCVDAETGDGQPVVCHAQILAETLRDRFGG